MDSLSYGSSISSDVSLLQEPRGSKPGLASVLQAASLYIVVQLAASSHACRTVRLALTSSGTDQYRRVTATGGGKDRLITAVEWSLQSVQTTATSQRCWHLSHCWHSLRACRRRSATLPRRCKRGATSLPYRKRAHAAAASVVQHFRAKTHCSDTCASPTPAPPPQQRRTRARPRR